MRRRPRPPRTALRASRRRPSARCAGSSDTSGRVTRRRCSSEQAALAVVPRLEGAAALAFVSAKDPGKIVAARVSNAGGVIVGYGQGENYLASDIPALLEHTRTVSFVEPGEFAVITATAV